MAFPLSRSGMSAEPKVEAKIKSYSPRYMEQAPIRGHEASPQSGLGVGCELFSSRKKLRVRALARRIGTSHLFSVVGVSSYMSPPRSAKVFLRNAQKAWDAFLIRAPAP